MSIKLPVELTNKGTPLPELFDSNGVHIASNIYSEHAREIAAKLNLWPQLVTALLHMTESTVSDDRYLEIKALLAACEKIEKGTDNGQV